MEGDSRNSWFSCAPHPTPTVTNIHTHHRQVEVGCRLAERPHKGIKGGGDNGCSRESVLGAVEDVEDLQDHRKRRKDGDDGASHRGGGDDGRSREGVLAAVTCVQDLQGRSGEGECGCASGMGMGVGWGGGCASGKWMGVRGVCVWCGGGGAVTARYHSCPSNAPCTRARPPNLSQNVAASSAHPHAHTYQLPSRCVAPCCHSFRHGTAPRAERHQLKLATPSHTHTSVTLCGPMLSFFQAWHSASGWPRTRTHVSRVSTGHPE